MAVKRFRRLNLARKFKTTNCIDDSIVPLSPVLVKVQINGQVWNLRVKKSNRLRVETHLEEMIEDRN